MVTSKVLLMPVARGNGRDTSLKIQSMYRKYKLASVFYLNQKVYFPPKFFEKPKFLGAQFYKFLKIT